MLSGALAVGALAALRRRDQHGYLGMLAPRRWRWPAIPGRGHPASSPAEVPLAGVVVSYCLSFGVVLLLLCARAAGRPMRRWRRSPSPCLLLTFRRTLVWAADGARLTRQVLRTEAYFRTLVHRAADITIVLDPQGRITWASGAGQRPTAGRRATSRAAGSRVRAPRGPAELQRRSTGGDPEEGRGPTFRLRSRDGSWPQFETIRSSPRRPCPAGPPGAEGSCCTCATSPTGAAPSSSSSAWPTPTTSPGCPTAPGSWPRSRPRGPGPPRASPPACC